MTQITQKWLAIAAVAGALIIAAALVYHGRQLGIVSERLVAMEQRTAELDLRLGQFSTALPGMVEQAGRNAGREAVHGVVEEVFEKPLSWLKSTPAQGVSNVLQRSGSFLGTNGFVLDPGAPIIRFDISKPVVRIEVLPNLKSVSTSPMPSGGNSGSESASTNHDAGDLR